MSELKVVKTMYEIWVTPMKGCGWTWQEKPKSNGRVVRRFNKIDDANVFLSGMNWSVMASNPTKGLFEIRETLVVDDTKTVADFI